MAPPQIILNQVEPPRALRQYFVELEGTVVAKWFDRCFAQFVDDDLDVVVVAAERKDFRTPAQFAPQASMRSAKVLFEAYAANARGAYRCLALVTEDLFSCVVVIGPWVASR